MSQRRRRAQRERQQMERLLDGTLEEEDRADEEEPFSERSAGAEQRSIERTALLRAAEQAAEGNLEALPIGEVVQVYSLFQDVEYEEVVRLCVVRKTLNRLLESPIVVGDRVRFRETGITDEQGRPEAVIEAVLPRQSVLTRAKSFKGLEAQPIVANAEQMLIVASLLLPEVRWGLVDRMIVAALGGGLKPVLCLNKVDLANTERTGPAAYAFAKEAMAHYASLGIEGIEASIVTGAGLEALREALRGRRTVLAGHSGVGKSSLIRAIQPALDLRVGAISGYTGKGRHTTTSARRYVLEIGGQVIDTPGVKMFGLWGVTREKLEAFFPDVAEGTAPSWRTESYARIAESVPGE